MAKGQRMTPFARLLLFLLFVGPLSYMAASYYNGEDGVENVKNIINKGKDKISTTVSSDGSSSSIEDRSSSSSSSSSSSITISKSELQQIEDLLVDLKTENEELKQEIEDLKAALQNQ